MAKRINAKGRGGAPGGFAGIPRIVMDHSDYQGLSFTCKALLLDMAYQYRGNNNGDLTVVFAVLKRRGWKREATINNAVKKLLAANLVILTREGRFSNPGSRCNLYALTWQPVDECKGKGLEVQPTTTPPRKFSMENK